MKLLITHCWRSKKSKSLYLNSILTTNEFAISLLTLNTFLILNSISYQLIHSKKNYAKSLSNKIVSKSLTKTTIKFSWSIHVKKKNSYIFDMWKFVIRTRFAKIFIFWNQWHRRFEHFNFRDVKKFATMNFIDDFECFKLEKIDSQHDKCESCIMNKMHRTSNHKTMKTNSTKRVTRKKQKFHTNLIEKNYIVRIFRDKRYTIIFVNDYIDYVWLYLIKNKFDFVIVFKNFIYMIKIQKLTIEFFCINNVKKKSTKKSKNSWSNTKFNENLLFLIIHIKIKYLNERFVLFSIKYVLFCTIRNYSKRFKKNRSHDDLFKKY